MYKKYINRIIKKVNKRKEKALELDKRVEKFYLTKKGFLVNAIVKDYEDPSNKVIYARVKKRTLEPLVEEEVISKRAFTNLVKKEKWREI